MTNYECIKAMSVECKNENSIFDWLFSSMDELIDCDYLL